MLSARPFSSSASLFSFACISTEILLHMYILLHMIGLIFNFSRRISAPEGQTFYLLMTVTAPESAALPDKLSVDICWQDESGLPWWLSGKESACQTGDLGSILGEIPWLRKSQPTPVYLTEKSYRQKSMAGYSSWGRRRIRCHKQQQHEWRHKWL